MGQLGFGVMLNYLAGHEDSVKAYQKGLNKKIAALSIKDQILELVFDDGYTLKFEDQGQSCCESRYMCTDDNLSDHIGAVFLEAEIKDAPSVNDSEYGEHEVQFLDIKTDKGIFQISNHNEHNGYYGGFNVRCSGYDVN